MDNKKSLDESEFIAAILNDVHALYGTVFNCRALRLTCNKVRNRVRCEGLGFITKSLPRLGKALDRALTHNAPLNSIELGFKPQRDSKLPMFMGEFFNRVLDKDGLPLHDPCTESVAVLRIVLYVMYKYELPYTPEQEQQVIQKFERTEDELSAIQVQLDEINHRITLENATLSRSFRKKAVRDINDVARGARRLLSSLFAHFDPSDIIPRHGPGAVSTRERLWNKYLWTNVAEKITEKYPLDQYFFASMGHVCDRLQEFRTLTTVENPARVCLVPKDSRGPRLISCEPVDFQWVQQGLGRAVVELVEKHPLTRYSVHFTDQNPNQNGAKLGSITGGYATLDLNEASDRVTVSLVRLLFPPHICEYLEACRSSETVLPDGRHLRLRKFAPMGSCLCFPVLALTIWSLLTAAAPDTYTRDRILVYGDDVVVPTAYAENAMKWLESFGLKINLDKSCTKGFFRESCGVDAFKGINVTPVRIRTVWASTPSPDVYTSWIAYANSFWDKRYYYAYDYIVERLHAVYGAIPDEGMKVSCPSLRFVPDELRPKRWRTNARFQRREWYCRDVKVPTISFEIDGWAMLLRWFSEKASNSPDYDSVVDHLELAKSYDPAEPRSVSEYTRRRTSMLVRRWR